LFFSGVVELPIKPDFAGVFEGGLREFVVQQRGKLLVILW
jgi:hypothetical protein